MAGTLSVQQIQGLATAADPTTVEISSGHVLKAPGHVIQTVYASDRPSTNVTAGDYNSTGTEISSNVRPTITPKFANSKLQLTITCDLKMTSDCQGAHVTMHRDDTLVTTDSLGTTIGNAQSATVLFIYRSDAGTNNHHFSVGRVIELNANNTNSTTFKFYGQRFNGSGTAQFANWIPLSVIIREIAQ